MADVDRVWDLRRGTGQHLSEDEKEFIYQSGLAGKTRIETARALKCSVRTIDKWYAKFGFVKKYKTKNNSKPIEKKPKEKKILPDRFYHSNFEPS